MTLTKLYSFLILTLVIFLASTTVESFKEIQKKFPRVQKAYKEKESGILKMLDNNAIDVNRLRIYLRAFKLESKIELWGKNQTDETFKLLKVYSVCNTSGTLGPKRVQGDKQIPEGFYHISAFNPNSKYHLSMALNYPNKSDRILGHKSYPGGNICIHGACATIGCLPITDHWIEELYIFCIEAKNNGQDRIPVTIFPAELNKDKYEALINKHSADVDKALLWKELKQGYDFFNETKKLPGIRFLENGRHAVSR